MTPTQRTKQKLAAEGWPLVAVVERWNPHARIRQDLFGCIDILAVRGNETLAIQTTSKSAVSARVRKMEDNPAMPILRAAGWTIHVHGWRKVKVKRGGKAMRWECRVVDLS